MSDLAEAVRIAEPTEPPPVYEITEEGLIQTQGDVQGLAGDPADAHQEAPDEEQGEPESEA